MPDPVEIIAAPDAPAPLSQEEITAEAVRLGTEAAAAEDRVPEPVADEPEGEPEPEPEPEPAPEPAQEPEPAPEPEPEPVELTAEQQDEADAKELGFKNQRATAEFKAMRAELREIRPLKDELEETKPLAEMWSRTYSYLKANNISSDRFGQGMAMIAGTESNDPEIIKKTIGGLEMEADRLRQKLGVAGGTYNPLTEPGNADLARAVDDGEITPQFAAQTAHLRAENAHRATLESNRQQQTQQQQESQQARAQAVSQLDATGQEYASLDPQYEAKAAILVGVLKPVLARLPPSEWDAAFRQAYKEIKLPATASAAPPAGQQPPPLRNQPLRAGSTPTGKVGEITTEADALNAALQAAAAIDGVPYRQSA